MQRPSRRRYARNLKFEECPKYDYLKSLFTNILIKNQQKIDFNFFWIVKKEKEKNERKNEDDKSKRKKEDSKKKLFNRIKQSLEKDNSKNIISAYKLENKESNKSTEKPNENKSEIKNEDHFKSYNINKTKENTNKLNLNEILINNYNYNAIDLNQNDYSKIISANILRNNDKCEECEINLKNKIDEVSLNNDKNRSGFLYKRILINPSKEQNLSGNLNKIINKSRIATYIQKRDKLKNIKIMRYKTLEERQNLNNTNNLYYKYEVDVNDNNFNQIMFGNLEDKSCKSIKNYRINNIDEYSYYY